MPDMCKCSTCGNEHVKNPEALVCPECGGPMLERTNRQSGNKFYGCKKYPDCKGTRDSEGLSRDERQKAAASTVAPIDERFKFQRSADNDKRRWEKDIE